MNTFSSNEIVQLALQIEREGHAFYLEAERLCKAKPAKELFHGLGEEELLHAATFRRIAAELAVDSSEYVEEEAQAYLQALVAGRVFTDPRETFDRASAGEQTALIRYAIGFEKETILYFHALRDIVREKDRPLVDRLIAEEKGHVKRLVNMLHSA